MVGGGFSGLIFIAIAGLLFIASALSPNSFGALRMGAVDAVSPAINAVSKPINAVVDTARNVSGIAELQAENIRLQQENLKLKEWYQTALLLEAENKSLKDLLNVKVDPTYTTITARILSDPGNTFVKSILVSAGSADGVQKGQAVLSGEGLIGRVTEVGQNSARVLLITDVNARVPVLIEDTRQHAIMAGTNQEVAQLRHLPPDSDVKSGARIVTSGQGGMFPPGLAIGRVQKTKSGALNVHPFADFNRIVHVRVIDKGQPLANDPNLIVAPVELH